MNRQPLHRPTAALVALLLAIASVPGIADAAVTRIFALDASPSVARFSVDLRNSTTAHVVELRNFAADADPVVYVLDSTGRQAAAGIAASGRVALSVAGNGQHTVIVRSRSSSAARTGDLWVDGQLSRAGVSFAQGAAIAMPQVAPNEKVMAVAAPMGPESHDAYLLSADGLNVLASTLGSHTSMSPPSTRDVLAVYAAHVATNPGPLRVYRNDAANDTDGDGLGDELEAALGTCASTVGSVAGANCNEIADPRDTDGDGLQDGWEVLGLDVAFAQGNATRHEYLALPTWGADPRHKDIFVEVDYRRLNLDENTNGVVHHMMPAVARAMAGIYGDAATTDFWLKAAHAVSVDNPDRMPGISLHLDTGVAPESPQDATIYGDWGGFNAVDATATGPQDPGTAMQQQMSPGRRGVFHYVLGYTGGGGSCGPGIACGFNMNDPGNSAHEFGHTLGLDHNGPNFVQDEPNCKPNYPSLMNYAYLLSGYRQFSDGRNFPHFDNHTLVETNAVNPSNQALLTALESYFRYKVDHTTGSVDWNRDGVFSPMDVPVRAYANYQPGGECEFTREGAVPTGLHGEHSPALVQVGGFLWALALERTGDLAVTRSTVPWTCALNNPDNCPAPQFGPAQRRNIGVVTAIDAKVVRLNGRDTIVVVAVAANGTLRETTIWPMAGGAMFGPVTTIPSSGAAGEPSLAVPSQPTSLALAYRGRDNTVRLRVRTTQGWSPEQAIVVGGQPLAIYGNASPAIVYTGLPIDIVVGEHLMLAAADSNGVLQFYSRQLPQNRWGRIAIPYSTMEAKAGRPVMAWTGSVPGSTTQVTRRRIAGAPSMNYGRLYVIYLKYQEPAPIYHSPTNPPMMAMSYVDGSGVLRIGLDAYFDNEWAYAYGLSALTPTGGALRVAMTSAVLPNHGTTPEDVVYFRPHADGMADLLYSNYDDWKTLAHDSCSVLAATQASSPVHCAAPW